MKVRYTIEGSGLGMRPFSDEIEVPAEELADLDDEARRAVIGQWVENEVNNHVQWGWDIIPDDEEPR